MRYHAYSSDHVPSFPVLELGLGAPEAEATLGPVEALIDTGADATLIPVAYLEQIGAEEVDRASMHSQWRERRIASIYSVAMEVDGHQFSAMWVVGDEWGDEIVLGRSVLNRLRLLLDGPVWIDRCAGIGCLI